VEAQAFRPATESNTWIRAFWPGAKAPQILLQFAGLKPSASTTATTAGDLSTALLADRPCRNKGANVSNPACVTAVTPRTRFVIACPPGLMENRPELQGTTGWFQIRSRRASSRGCAPG
jgi:hypothetical protein